MKGSARRGTVVVVFTLVSLAAFAPKPSRRSIAEATPNSIEPTKGGRFGHAPMVESYGKVPLSFEANRGQTDPRVKFLSRGSGYTLFLTGDEAVLSLRSQESGAALSEAKGVRNQKQEGRPWSLVPSHLQKPTDRAQGTKGKGPGTNDVLRMKLVGANQAAKVAALDELPGKSNYFIGNDPKKWRTGVPTYGKVKYEGVYPGIDLVYYGNQRQLEYDFVVAPGANPKAITLAVASGLSPARAAPSLRSGQALKGGATAGAPTKARQALPLRIDASGDLVAQAEGGEIRFHKPVVYQPTADAVNPKSQIQNRKLLDGHYVLTADNRIGFEVPGYDKSKPLVIDPVLVYFSHDPPEHFKQPILMGLLPHRVRVEAKSLWLGSGLLHLPWRQHRPGVRRMRQRRFDHVRYWYCGRLFRQRLLDRSNLRV